MALDRSSLLFTSPDQVREGLLWTDRRQTLEAQYWRLWRNDPASRAAGVTTRFNWYRKVTEFWTDLLWGRKPANVSQPVADAFEEASTYRSIKGTGVVVVDGDGTLRPVDSSNWYPIYNPVDRNQMIGHIVSYFYRADPSVEQSEMHMPDRADMLVTDLDGTGTRRTFLVEGQTLGRLIDEAPLALRGIVEFGGHYSDYVDLIPIVQAYEHRFARLTRVLDNNSDPHLMVPHDALDDTGRFRVAADGGSMFLPLTPDTPRYEYLSYEGLQEAQRAVMSELRDEFSFESSVPLSVFGVRSQEGGFGESGVARERQLFAAIQKLRRLRRELAEPVTRVMGLVGETIPTVDWPDIIFSSYVEQAVAEVQLVGAGIIDAERARDHLGIER